VLFYEREVFRFEEEYGLEESMLVDRARACAALMEGYAQSGETDQALAVHAELGIPDQAALPPGVRLALATALSAACLQAGDTDRALEVFRGSGELPPLDGLQEGRASMAAALMNALAAKGDLEGASVVYGEAEFPGAGIRAGQARAFVEGTMASLLAAAGLTDRAAGLLWSARFREACRGHPLVAARASLAVAEAFVREGRLGEARAVCESGNLDGPAKDGAAGKALSVSAMISRLCLEGDLESARRLFERLPDGRRSRKAALSRVMALMSLRDAYAEAGDAEGLAFVRSCAEGLGALEARLFERDAAPGGAG
ncbi:MAG: hypothetical protein LBG06_00505, partial [Deltaproteobacteria bacterium]|nr:hypothetical protein [Deltaproteobacteria bacterium]